MNFTIEDIRKAARTIATAVPPTPTVHSAALSATLGTSIYLKLESLHRTGSFKERGALNRLSALTPAESSAGVIACSAGNHAQGVAYHAGMLGIPATIVMPKHTPFTKIERTRNYGAEVLLYGKDLSEAMEHCFKLAKEKGLLFVSPYDDPLIMAGQGTIALEMLEAEPDLDVLVVPVGGGGMISGVAVAAKAIKPSIEIVGVQTEFCPSVKAMIDGSPLPHNRAQTVAEGIAVKSPSKTAIEIIKSHVDRVELVSEPLIEQAIYLLLSSGKIVAEGAAAVTAAEVLKSPERYKGKKTGLIISGGNIDSRILASILERALVRNGMIVHLMIEIPDQPGVLAQVSRLIGDANANIIEVFHQRLLQKMPLKNVELEVVIETQDRHHAGQVVAALEAAGFATSMMTA